MRHHDRLFRFVTRLTGTDSAADEIVNDVFLAVWRHAAQFEGKSQVSTWLLGIARFKAISECRRRSELPLDDCAAAAIEDTGDGPATSFEKRQRSDILQRCLAKLTPSHRDVINLIYYQGKKIEEVAEFDRRTGRQRINTRLHYARSRMAELLAETGVDRVWLAV